MDFGDAIKALKTDKAVAREGWDGKGMFIVLMPALNLPAFSASNTTTKISERTARWIGDDTPLRVQPYIAMFTAQRNWQPGWLASQADMLADDWYVVKENHGT